MKSAFTIKLLLDIVAFSMIGFLLPWWSISLVAAIIGWQEPCIKKSFTRGFLACFSSWLILTLIFDALSGFRISPRIGGLAHLPFPIAANLISSAIGSLAAGLTAITINQLKQIFISLSVRS